MKNKNNLIIGLLGIIAGLLLVLTFQVQSSPNAIGQTAAATSQNILMATATYAGNGCACWIYDTTSKHLAVYGVTGTRLAGLVGARLCTYDFNINQYPSTQRLSVKNAQTMAKSNTR